MTVLTELHIRRAMNRLGSVYPQPHDLEGAYREWRDALRKPGLDLQPAELDQAVSRFIATTAKSFGYPNPAQIIGIVKAHRTASSYTEPDDGPRATPEDVRNAWERHLDLDELKRSYQAMRARSRRPH